MIINADDFGLSHSVNLAIVECFNRNFINQTTIMVNMPFFDEAIELSRNNGFFNKVGIHINLDTGVPLTEKIKKNKSFCSEDGSFNGEFFKRIKNNFILSKIEKECINEEIEAQFLKYIDNGFELMHFDSHHHIHNQYSILNLIIPLAKKYDFNTARLCRNIYIHKPSLDKRIYKYIINCIIRMNFNTTKFFGSYSDYVFNENKYDIVNSEIMLHPDISDDLLVDIINKSMRKSINDYKVILK